MSTGEPNEVALQRCEALIHEADLHAVLRYLNGRTRHRYTGVYRFDPPTLRNLCLYDRENPALRVGGDSPMVETYCSLVGTDRAPYATDDASRAPRLASHPARGSILAYCGVPLRDRNGSCFGTLCHFDHRPRLVPVTELPLLTAVAPLIAGEALRLNGSR